MVIDLGMTIEWVAFDSSIVLIQRFRSQFLVGPRRATGLA
jgi:hypothetical protein